jgi:hypothetical protein
MAIYGLNPRDRGMVNGRPAMRNIEFDDEKLNDP